MVTRDQVLHTGAVAAQVRQNAIKVMGKMPRVNGQVEMSLRAANAWLAAEKLWKSISRAGISLERRMKVHGEAQAFYQEFLDAAARRGYTL